ncbi:MAG TPA: hypothetical protein VGC89_14640 [Pyrinomonadaceae bacterium]
MSRRLEQLLLIMRRENSRETVMARLDWFDMAQAHARPNLMREV